MYLIHTLNQSKHFTKKGHLVRSWRANPIYFVVQLFFNCGANIWSRNVPALAGTSSYHTYQYETLNFVLKRSKIIRIVLLLWQAFIETALSSSQNYKTCHRRLSLDAIISTALASTYSTFLPNVLPIQYNLLRWEYCFFSTAVFVCPGFGKSIFPTSFTFRELNTTGNQTFPLEWSCLVWTWNPYILVNCLYGNENLLSLRKPFGLDNVTNVCTRDRYLYAITGKKRFLWNLAGSFPSKALEISGIGLIYFCFSDIPDSANGHERDTGALFVQT